MVHMLYAHPSSVMKFVPLGTIPKVTCRIKKEIHIVLCQMPPPPHSLKWKKFDVLSHTSLCIPLVCVHHSWLTFIMFNFKTYLGEWYYHRNWLQIHLFISSWEWNNLIGKYEMGSWPLTHFATDFRLCPTCNFLDSPLEDKIIIKSTPLVRTVSLKISSLTETLILKSALLGETTNLTLDPQKFMYTSGYRRK